MAKLVVVFTIGALMLVSVPISGQQPVRLPDVSTLKHLTTKASDHDANIPGNETTMDFYSGTGGQIITIYSYRGRKIAFSSHNNSDYQNTYRIYMDMTGGGMFQEISPSARWQLPPWSKQ
ncbi:MAG: hypothetical protein V2B18_04270 [Pseudomonadota bacterium]